MRVCSTRPASTSRTIVGPSSVTSSSPSLPVTTTARRMCGWRDRTSASKARVGFVRHADELVRRAGGIAERADQVEDRAKRSWRRTGASRARPGWNLGANRKAIESSARQRRETSGSGSMRHAQRGQHVRAARAARGRAVAVLDDRHAAGRRDDRRRRRDVDRARTVAAGPAGVEQALAGDSALPGRHPFADGADGPLELVGRLAFLSQGRQERCGKSLGRLAIEQRPDRLVPFGR